MHLFLNDIISVIKNRGFIAFLKIVVSSFFSKKYSFGEDFDFITEFKNFDNSQFSKAPKSTRVRELVSLFSVLNKNSTFIDYGSGSGRTLSLALSYQFKKVIGIELNPKMYNYASRQLSKSFPKEKWQLIHNNFLLFTSPDEQCIHYIYDPTSSDKILEKLIKNIKEAQSKQPQYLIYHNNLISVVPIYFRKILGSSYTKHTCMGSQFFIYQIDLSI